MGFNDEPFETIMNIVADEIGLYAKNNPQELFANALGIWYYGLGDHPHVDSLISYIKETAR